MTKLLEVGARNERRICAVNCNKNAGFEVVHGLLDKIMMLLEVSWSPNKDATGYYLQATDGNIEICLDIFVKGFFTDPTFFPGRCAKIICNNKDVGRIGVVHPDVLHKFELGNPCSAVEINIEQFV